MFGIPLSPEEIAIREKARLDDGASIGALNDRASDEYPSVLVDGHGVHVCYWGGDDWQVWLNPGDADFTGTCVGAGATRDAAVAQAVAALEAITEFLQGPAPAEREAQS